VTYYLVRDASPPCDRFFLYPNTVSRTLCQIFARKLRHQLNGEHVFPSRMFRMVRAGCKVTVPFQFVQVMDSQKRLTYSAHRILQDDVFFRKLLSRVVSAWSAQQTHHSCITELERVTGRPLCIHFLLTNAYLATSVRCAPVTWTAICIHHFCA
jgi:hypothetical protein